MQYFFFHSVLISFFSIRPLPISLFIPYVFSHSSLHCIVSSSLVPFVLYYLLFCVYIYFFLHLLPPSSFAAFSAALFSLPRPSVCFWDPCHCCTDTRNTVGVRLMGWQTSACNSSKMPHRSSQPASSTLLSALPPAARCRYCPSLFGTDEEVPAYWLSFVRTRAQDIMAAKIFSPTCHLVGHTTVSTDISHTSVALVTSGRRRRFVS